MPKLNILQHKSYHPYLEKNKQRVREDEAKAAAEELAREQKRIDVDSEARLAQLRRRAGSPTGFAVDPSAAAGNGTGDDDNLPSTSTSRDRGDSLIERQRKKKLQEEKRERKKRDRLDFDFPKEGHRASYLEKDEDAPASSGRRDEWTAPSGDDWSYDKSGHINFFTDLEEREKGGKAGPSLSDIAKQKQKEKEKEDPFTMYLSRPERETKPWYTDKDLKRVEDKEIGEEAEERRARDRRKDLRSKDRNDPLSLVNSLLSSHTSKSHPPSRHRHPTDTPKDPATARHNRETSERQRALALIAQSKQPQRWDDTPSSVGGTWGDRFEREKDRAGRFFSGADPQRSFGGARRSWEI